MPVTVEATTGVDILRMTASEFRRLIDSHQQIRWNFIVLLSNINVFLTTKLKVLSLMSVREKIGTMLIQLAKQQNSRVITLKESRQDIANKFGIQKFYCHTPIGNIPRRGCHQHSRKNHHHPQT